MNPSEPSQSDNLRMPDLAGGGMADAPLGNETGDEVTIAESKVASPGVNAASPKKHTGPLVIAIANQKGGVAKTTTAVSLGGALARHDQEVLLVDLDAQANLTLALGKDPSRVRGAVTEVLFNSASLLSVSRETSIPGLDLVPANAGMDLAERFLPVRRDYETILRRALRTELRPASGTSAAAATAAKSPAGLTENSPTSPRPPTIHYDFVLLDCPPFLGAVTLNALVAADLLIIPTQPEFFSAHALRTMTTAIRQVRNHHNPDLVYRILITLSDRRNRIHREVGEQIRSTFGEGVFQTIIEVDTKLRESAVEGLPITHHKSQSRSALQYDALAQELLAYV
jgi:chromosome partitioning protein